jgi:uncharacterized protein involved in copper resistance
MIYIQPLMPKKRRCVKRYRGQGFNEIELCLRLRYEIRRLFAPHIGISWNRIPGGTGDLAEVAEPSLDNWSHRDGDLTLPLVSG